MRKLKFILPLALTALVGLFAFTSCEDPVLAEKNTWYETTETIDIASGGTTSLKMYFFYTSDDTPKTFGRETVTKGLTVVVQPTTTTLGNNYLIKTFGDEKQATDTDESGNATADSGTIELGGTALDTLYLKYGSDFKKRSQEPDSLAADSGYTHVDSLSDITEGLTWKSIFKKMLAKYLLED